MRTSLPNTSPDCSRSKPRAASRSGSTSSTSGRDAGRLAQAQQLLELGARPHGRAEHPQLQEEQPVEVGGRVGPAGGARHDERAAGPQRPHRVRPRRLADRLDDGVDAGGQPRARSRTPRARPSSRARARLASSRLVAQTTSPAARPSTIAAVATPPPAPCTSTRSPGLSPLCVKSIRYAVSHAVGRHAACSKDRPAGLSHEVARRHDHLLGERALVALGQDAALRVERLVAGPVGVADERVHDDLAAVVGHARRVAAQHHRQPVGRQADALERPQVVVVERGGPHVHAHPAVRHLGLGPLPDLEAGQRVVGGLGDAGGGEHGGTLAGGPGSVARRSAARDAVRPRRRGHRGRHRGCDPRVEHRRR